jgi:hypothetical protein
MRRTHQHAKPSCPVGDEDVPSCTTGPSEQLCFVARELADIARGVLSAASRRGDRSIGGGSETPKGDADGPSTRRDGGTTP